MAVMAVKSLFWFCDTDSTAAKLHATRIKEALHEMNYAHDHSSVSDRVTASQGVLSFAGENRSLQFMSTKRFTSSKTKGRSLIQRRFWSLQASWRALLDI